MSIDSMRNNFLRDRTINYSAQLFSVIGIHCRLENFNYCPQNLQLASRLWPHTVDPRFVSGMYRRCAYVFVTIMRRLQSIHCSVYTGCFWNTHPIKLYKSFRSEQIAMGWKFHKTLRVWSFGANFHYRSLALLSRCSLRPKNSIRIRSIGLGFNSDERVKRCTAKHFRFVILRTVQESDLSIR